MQRPYFGQLLNAYHPHCRYVPNCPDGVSTVLVGGDRLTEANCRNIQWSFAEGADEKERMERMVFMFEDWHAIRVLFEVRTITSHILTSQIKING